MQTRTAVESEMKKVKRRAIINLICYVVGLLMILFWTLFRSTCVDLGVEDLGVVGLLLCGFYNGLTFYKARKEARAAYEREHGANYVMDETGTIRKQSDFWMRIGYFFMGVVFGIFLTPFQIITDFRIASRDKKALVEFDAEIAKAKNF